MDIYTYLKKDHRLVADLMDKVVESQDAAERQALFEQIKAELKLHADTEEQTFYKAIEDATRSKNVEKEMEHAHHEHDEIRDYLDKLSTTPVEDEAWIETFGEFRHAVAHHVEEEEGDIFEEAKKYIDSAEATKLARDMDALKKQARAKTAEPMPAL